MARKTEGRIFRRGNAVNWHADYTINGKRIKQVLRDNNGNTITDKETAEKMLADLLNPLKLNDKIEQARVLVSAVVQLEEKAKETTVPLIPIAQVWKNFISSPNRSDCGDRTLSDYAGYWRLFAAWLDSRKETIPAMQEITAEVAAQYATELTMRRVSAGTYNKHITFLKMLFRVMAKNAGMPVNPFGEIKLKKNKINSRRELTLEELYKVLDSATGKLALLLGLGTFTGLRLGDCCTLQWSEIDLRQRIIRRRPNKTANSSDDPVVIGIPSPLYNRLSEIPVKLHRGYLLPEYAEKYNFVNVNGHCVKRGEITNEIQRHFKACGIRTGRDGTGDGTGKRAVVEVGFHSLRHTYVSLHAMNGTPAAIIQRNVGHANPAMTEHYTHISVQTARQIASALEKPFAAVESKDELNVLLESMNAQNWEEIKQQLLMMARNGIISMP